MRRFFSFRRVWLWLLLFFLAFSGFFAHLWLNQFLKIKTLELARAADHMGIRLNGLRIVKIPPSLHLDSLEIPVREKTFVISQPALELDLLPLALSFSARLLGGNVHGIAGLELGFPPRISLLKFSVDNLQLAELMALSKLGEFAVMDGGYLDGSGKLSIKKYVNSLPDWDTTEGEARFELKEGGLTLKLPLLRKDKLTGIHGDFLFRIKGVALDLESCRLKSSPMLFEAHGGLSPWPSPEKARLQVNTELRVPEDLLNSSLIPERTLAMIREKGLVRTKIAGPFLSPEIYLEN